MGYGTMASLLGFCSGRNKESMGLPKEARESQSSHQVSGLLGQAQGLLVAVISEVEKGGHHTVADSRPPVF